MCMVSAVGDNFRGRLPEKDYWPGIQPFVVPGFVPNMPPPSQVSRLEFDALKRDLEELKKVLVAAKRFDEVAGEPDCEMDEKVAIIKKLAEITGVSMEDVFGPRT
jgi:hypothetical protein